MTHVPVIPVAVEKIEMKTREKMIVMGRFVVTEAVTMTEPVIMIIEEATIHGRIILISAAIPIIVMMYIAVMIPVDAKTINLTDKKVRKMRTFLVCLVRHNLFPEVVI